MAFLDQPGPIAFAHRGFDRGGAENSMRAFQQAVDLGYRYLETDVRVSADGVAFAFHDARLDRVTDRSGVIAELPAREIERALIGGSEPIPLLDDVLAAWPQARLNLDLKAERSVAPTIAAVRRTGSVERVCIGAFADARVATARRALGAGVLHVVGTARSGAVAARVAGRTAAPRCGG